MNKQNTIVFKMREFPLLSETFIVHQIVTAIKLNYEVIIVVKSLLDFDAALHPCLITEYKLLDKVIIENYNIPKNLFWRLIKGLFLLAYNIKHLKFIKRFYNLHAGFSLTWFYQWLFYKSFNNAAIVHVQYGTNKDPLDLLKKTGFFKPKLVVTFHGHDAFFPINGFIPNNGYYDDLFCNANLVTANTPYLADQIRALGCSKDVISIIPVGVNTDFFYPPSKGLLVHSQLKLLTVGRLDKVKGHNYCIEVANKLKKQGVDVSLTIIGEGSEKSNLEQLIFSYGLKDCVFMLGRKSALEIREALWNHDLYLLLAVPVLGGRRETQGLATLEAQACGVPVIVFNSGGVKYTVMDEVTGFICKEYDIHTVANKIELFDKNRNLIKDMGDKAVSFVNENYSQKRIDERWGNVYNELVDE